MAQLSYFLDAPAQAARSRPAEGTGPLRRMAATVGTWLLAIAAMALVLSADWMLYTALESSLHLCFPQ